MDVTVHRFSDSYRPAWQSLAETALDSTLAHAAAWLSLIPKALGHANRSLIAMRGGEVCGALPMMLLRHWLLGTFNVSLPWLDYGGIIATDPVASHCLLQSAITQARTDGASWIELRSVEKVLSDLPTRDEKVTFFLDLGSVERVWARLDSKVRNQIRKAQHSGLTCQFGGVELLADFYQVFARNMRDLGTPVWGIALFHEILAAFGKGAEIAVVRQGDRAVAAGLTIAFKDRISMPSASALRQFRSLSPNNLLYWEVIKRACETGYRQFDFGRSTKGSGTYHFKKQWGGTIIPLHWQYVLLRAKQIPQMNPSNPRFKLLVEAWKRLPVHLATRLGPRIVRHLP